MTGILKELRFGLPFLKGKVAKPDGVSRQPIIKNSPAKKAAKTWHNTKHRSSFAMPPRFSVPLFCAAVLGILASPVLAQIKIILPPIPRAPVYTPLYTPISAPALRAPISNAPSVAPTQKPVSNAPLAKFEPTGDRVYHGASLPDTWSEDGLRRQISQYNAAAGKRISVVTWFASTYENGRLTTWRNSYAAPLARVKKWGAMSLVKFSTQDYMFHSTGKQARLAEIANGKWDIYFQEAAQTVKEFGGPTFISIDHEMNGNWYPYSQAFPGGGQTASDFVAAWKRIVGIFRQRGAQNAAFVWSPNVPDVGGVPFGSYYPGDDFVDWIGVSFYSGNDMNAMDTIYRAYSAKKPFFITEWATAPEKSQYNRVFPGEVTWVKQFFQSLSQKYPRVKAISWFNWNKDDGDYRLQRVPEQALAYEQDISAPRYVDENPGIAASNAQPQRPRLEVPSSEMIFRESAPAVPPRQKTLAELIKIEPVSIERVRRER